VVAAVLNSLPQAIKKPPESGGFFVQPILVDGVDYLFMTYIVTSKPKRISVAAGLVHIMISLGCF
jgi:hypothetical protein